MPPPRHAKSGHPRPAWSKAQALAPFSATIVAAPAICQFVGVHGRGEPVAAWVAAQQLELITFEQWRLAGVSRDVIRARMKQGTVHRVHIGVYRVGVGPMLPGALELAAILACGEGACLRRRSAVALFGLSGRWDGDPEVVVAGRNRRRSGIAIERVQTILVADRGTLRGIPITSPARTLLDFAAVAAPGELEQAIAEAYALKLVTESELRAVIDRHLHRAGVSALRTELDRVGGPQWTQSRAEQRMKFLLRQAELPVAHTRVRVAGFPADFCWPEFRLIVEVDGYQFHGHPYAFARDRRRDQAHKTAGYEVLRFTWAELDREPLRVIAVIAMAIGRTQPSHAHRAGNV